MSIQNRDSLKNYFRKGQIPSERHFKDLIDSMINKVDDGMSKTLDDGLVLSPIGSSKKLISFYKSIEDKNPAWSFQIDSGDASLDINNHLGDAIMSFKSDGKIGISTRQPRYELDVNGTFATKNRMGTFHQGKIFADGKWHPVLEGLNGCYGLEVVAGIGKKKTGKYALIHAFTFSTFGKSKNKIKVNQAYYGVRCNKIELRWTGNTYNYNLEMRTRCSYGGNYFVKYHITNLWLDHFMDNSLDEEGDSVLPNQ
ncbi:MAG: adhesin [Bacteroidota bacterium]